MKFREVNIDEWEPWEIAIVSGSRDAKGRYGSDIPTPLNFLWYCCNTIFPRHTHHFDAQTRTRIDKTCPAGNGVSSLRAHIPSPRQKRQQLPQQLCTRPHELPIIKLGRATGAHDDHHGRRLYAYGQPPSIRLGCHHQRR